MKLNFEYFGEYSLKFGLLIKDGVVWTGTLVTRIHKLQKHFSFVISIEKERSYK
jgi:hypothetical protein